MFVLRGKCLQQRMKHDRKERQPNVKSVELRLFTRIVVRSFVHRAKCFSNETQQKPKNRPNVITMVIVKSL